MACFGAKQIYHHTNIGRKATCPITYTFNISGNFRDKRRGTKSEGYW